ncbi:MAG: hypothetical protein H6592_08920 [Flavobacteriales bacterium]|nr:hypothetical protein [Flavobacteriales bacterium]HPF91601.1 hypothetical protein [Flavobacteriales bacterium]
MRAWFALFVAIVLTVPLNAQVADAGPDQWVCGDSAYLQGNYPGIGFTGSWSVFSGSGTFALPSYGGSQVTGLAYGNNELVWSVTDGVTTTTDTVLIVAYDPSVTPVYTMGDTAITGPPFNIMLFASPYTYPQFCNWYLVAGSATIWQPNAYTTYASDLGIGENVFQWYCDNGPCGVSIQQLAISVNWITTSVVEVPVAAPFHFDPATGMLLVTSSLPIRDVRIRDVGGREVTGTALVDGMYVATANVGGTLYLQRFIVRR